MPILNFFSSNDSVPKRLKTLIEKMEDKLSESIKELEGIEKDDDDSIEKIQSIFEELNNIQQGAMVSTDVTDLTDSMACVFTEISKLEQGQEAIKEILDEFAEDASDLIALNKLYTVDNGYEIKKAYKEKVHELEKQIKTAQSFVETTHIENLRERANMFLEAPSYDTSEAAPAPAYEKGFLPYYEHSRETRAHEEELLPSRDINTTPHNEDAVQNNSDIASESSLTTSSSSSSIRSSFSAG